MGELEVDFKFHNVGQGLFYTGRLKYGRASFNFVYDCGSEKTSLVKDAISREFRPDEKIDLLVISHLHKDHTSGIPYLFNRTRVDTVILPYLSPLERLIIALTTSRASREYYTFLADPVTYSLEHKVRRVVLIGGEEVDRRENWMPPSERPPDLPLGAEGFEIIYETLYDGRLDERLRSDIEGVEEVLPNFINNGQVLVKDHSEILKVSLHGFPIWIFRFFNYKVSLQVLSQFEACVRRTLGGIDSRRIKNAIVNPSQRRALTSCYNQLVGGPHYLNNTSLIVIHRPAFKPSKIYSWYGCNWCLCCCPICLDCCPYCRHFIDCPLYTSDFVQFLTGDIDLNYRFNEISQHFRLGAVVNNTVATLVPHHGSHNNWNNKLCKDITSNFWVVSAGIRNKYGHPSCQVLRNIRTNCHDSCVVWVNEATYFRLMGVLEF